MAAGRGPSRARELTIGEAVARLAVQFPGLTVAAVRRLEAEGRFVAGRTPTGYRRYSESDLEQLRVVLSFGAAPGAAAVPRPAGAPEAAYAAAAAPPDPAACQRPAAPRRGAQIPQQPAQGVGSCSAPSHHTVRASVPHPGGVRAEAGHPDTRVAVHSDARTAVLTAVPPSGPAASAPTVPAPVPPAPVPAAAAPSAPEPQEPALPAPTRRGARRWPEAEFFAPDLGEVGFDRDQLAATVRVERSWIDQLVDFGLLPDRERYGGEQLLVARACAELAEAGLEPRHLRTVATSAARTAELVLSATASCTTARAARTAEAAAAAVRLHAALLRAALVRDSTTRANTR